MSDDRDEKYMAGLLADVRASVRLSTEAREVYRERVEQHIAAGAKVRPPRTRAESEMRASTDSIVRGAAGHVDYYDRRTIASAVAFLAEVFSVEIEGPE